MESKLIMTQKILKDEIQGKRRDVEIESCNVNDIALKDIEMADNEIRINIV